VGCRERRRILDIKKQRVLTFLAVIEQLKALSCLSNAEAQSRALLDIAAQANARALLKARLDIIRASVAELDQNLGTWSAPDTLLRPFRLAPANFPKPKRPCEIPIPESTPHPASSQCPNNPTLVSFPNPPLSCIFQKPPPWPGPGSR
jgi:hypothetical protein